MSLAKIGSFGDTVNLEKVNELINRVDENFIYTDEIISSIISSYCDELDAMLLGIKDRIKNNNELRGEELNRIIIEIPICLHFMADGIEKVGIKSDLITMIRKEVYNQEHLRVSGTVAIRESKAEEASQQETIVQVIYQRAYKILKIKFENAIELMNSCKKIISSEISAQELTRLDRN